jgi:signal transduction histidine kinase/CheY-like chemotaxis protein
MSRSCEFCGGEIQEYARSRNRVWIGCRRCLRSWREDLDAAAAPPHEHAPKPHIASIILESSVGRYVVAAVATAAALAIRLAAEPLIGSASPFLFFTPAVMVAAWFGGIGPAIFATVAGAAFGDYFFLRTLGETTLEQSDRIAMFGLVSALIITLTTVVKTHRRRLNDALWREQKARAQAEAATQAKDDFLSVVSHELQTPVSVIVGWASAIRKRQLRGEALTVALDAIERNAHVQSRLVQDILDRARIVNGHLRMEPQIVSVSEIVRAAVEEMRPVFDHRHIQLTTAIEDTPFRMSADPVRLQQVFTNLLSNAAKFTQPGGHVRIEASSTASTSTVTIRDDGVGISAEFLPHVFEGFRQDPHTSTASSPGLGLGLSIARHFVERHHGMIWANSGGPGTGATFTVVLPQQIQQVAVEDRRPQEAGAGALHALSVLLVEDDDDARQLLTETLEYYGAHVLPAASAAEAKRMLEQEHADVLLSDLRMPEEDGFALIHELRSRPDPEIADMPAAAITASRLTEDRHHAIAAGYQVQLQKPVDPDELVSAILTLANMLRNRPDRLH